MRQGFPITKNGVKRMKIKHNIIKINDLSGHVVYICTRCGQVWYQEDRISGNCPYQVSSYEIGQIIRTFTMP